MRNEERGADDARDARMRWTSRAPTFITGDVNRLRINHRDPESRLDEGGCGANIDKQGGDLPRLG